MQKAIIGMAVVWLVVVAGNSGLVWGQPAALTGGDETSTMRLGKDLSLTVGLDVWPNQWVKTVPNQTQTPQGSVLGQSTPLSSTLEASSFGVAFVPNVTLTYKRFFLSASYMVTPDYHFGQLSPSILPLSSDKTGLPQDVTVALQSRLTASRQEADLTIGYFPLDWLGVAIGYKGQFQDFHFDNSFSLLLPTSLASQPGTQNIPLGENSIKQRYNGPIAGVLASVRIDDTFTLIGNAFGGYLFGSCSASDQNSCSVSNSPYTGSKLVLRYAPTPQLSATLGYRVQIVNNRVDTFNPGAPPIRQTSVDLTHGLVVGVNYRF